MLFSNHPLLSSGIIFALTVCCHVARLHAGLPDTVDFNFHVRPVLSDRCYACHGPDAENREADLRLDVEQAAYAAMEDAAGTHVIKPGQPEQSELYLRISSTDEEMRMPPEGSNLSLTTDEIEVLRRWIEQGADWKSHWSFVPVQREPIPSTSAKAWPRNEIDFFVLARLEDEGLEPAAEATRERLIRRLSYDLTGLPPTLTEIDAFLAEKSPEAYEKVVDRLLASARYGERMAVDWLDLARYADTYGYQSDFYRPVWPWRDWVVRALNKNMPYDQFITWQLAGDLLPTGSRDQILATAFNRMHRQTNEGGSIEEEFRVEYVVDRTDTFGTAFLGLTLQCARCHDHKYDRLTQKEYYQLFSYFNSIDESGLYSHFTDAIPTPTLLLSQAGQEAKLDDLAQQIVEAEAQLEQIAGNQASTLEAWLAERRQQSTSPRAEILGLIGHFDMDSIDAGTVVNRAASEQHGQVSGGPILVPGKTQQGLQLSGESNFSTEVGGSFTRHDPFSIGLWINTPDEKDRAVIWHRSRAWTDAGSCGYQLLIEDGKFSASLIHFWPGNAIRVVTERKIPTNQWVHVLVTYDGSSQAAGLKIYVGGQPEDCTTIRDNLSKTIVYDPDHPQLDITVNLLTLGQRFRDRGFKNGLVDELAVYDRQLTAAEAAQVVDGNQVNPLLPLQWTDAQVAHLREYYLQNHNEEYREALQSLQKLRKAHGDLVDSIAEIMVMRELPEPRPTYLLKRGAYDAPGDLVQPSTPASLPAMAEEYPPNRLGLARWLTDARHPLTARVAVNRYWQMLFGIGLVATPDDFGSQGQLPSHLKLLDWLAKSFVDSGWDVKALLKQIVMSATYRQSSHCAPELRQRDPANIWMAHGPHNQLPAEMLRDGVLLVGGLLVEKQGGPPVKPYQPEGLWKEKGTETYKRDEGEGSHRRSLYTFWKRTSPPPAMLTLDAAKRDVCIVKRQSTATPLQSLVLLNDPQYVEASRALAQKAMTLGGQTIEDRTIYLFRTLTSRRPTDEETRLLVSTYDEQREAFQARPEDAKQFLAIGDHRPNENDDPVELAAMTVVAEMVMNYEEAVTK